MPEERVLLEPSVRTADRPLGPDQYRYVATRGWWMGSFGTSAGMLLHLTEQWIRRGSRPAPSATGCSTAR